ncbi:hypothetical protein Tco_0206200 [Tanacetum coccineum]
MAAFLEKSTGSEGFHQVIDFLSQSHISYALTKKPDIYISFIKQFWRTAEASTDTDGEVTITAIIDGQSKTITEASLRRHLKLEDHDGITSIPNSEIFEQLALMGYQPDSDNPKKTAWEQFSSNIATALICLATNRKYNFSRLIFEHMVTNIGSPHKFLMYPRFIQICLDMQKKQLKTHSKTYPVPSLNNKVFSNMRRLTKGYTGVEIGLFPTMLTSPMPESSPTPSSSPSRITSSPLLSFEPSTEPTFEPQPLPDAEYHVPSPNKSPLHAVHSHGSDEEDDLMKTKQTYSSAFTKLILRIKKLESKVKTGKARQRARVVFSEDEEDDSSKQGRKISDIDKDPNTYFAQDDEVVHDKDTAEEGQPEDSHCLIARQLLVLDEERVTTKTKTTKDIDWNDPSVQKYWNIKNKPKSKAQARKNMIVYLKNQNMVDFNHNFVPMDLEIKKKKKKTAEFQEIKEEKIEKDTSKKTTGKRKKSLPRTRT